MDCRQFRKASQRPLQEVGSTRNQFWLSLKKRSISAILKRIYIFISDEYQEIIHEFMKVDVLYSITWIICFITWLMQVWHFEKRLLSFCLERFVQLTVFLIQKKILLLYSSPASDIAFYFLSFARPVKPPSWTLTFLVCCWWGNWNVFGTAVLIWQGSREIDGRCCYY